MEILNYFKALSDFTRIRVLNILLNHELNVNEIVYLMDMSQPRISRHLKILTDAGLLECRRDGKSSFYLVPAKGPGREIIEAIQYLMEDEPLLKQDLACAENLVLARKERSVQFFDHIASRWDLLKREILGDFDLNEAVIQATPPSDVVVDLGCGTGELVEKLQYIAGRVIGVDSSSKMIELARKRVYPDREKVDLRLGELEHLPLKNEEADCAVVSMVLHHVATPDRFVSEVSRVIKNNGALVIADFDKHHDESLRQTYGDRWLGFSKDEILGFLGPNGFTMIEDRSFKIEKNLTLNLYRSVLSADY
ncbi:MAG: metalloregulator ArsR/SmtB family transcription factor [Deltaproteobacteria bacterium]|nr:metalloregulator ArsR/SmtB family transcription factor [Deltaproteobacteria bacterium]